MKPYYKNPRKITPEQRERLEGWMDELGDLGGVVHDLESDQIIGGNQRSGVMDINECEIELAHEYDEPDAQGTVALGYVLWREQRFSYRAVRWTAEQCEKANIVANAAGGDWDIAMLLAEFDRTHLTDWGLDQTFLDQLVLELSNDEGKDAEATAEAEAEEARQTLAERFVIPPFSVLDTRQGYWQTRKQAWLSLGIQSELGRGDELEGALRSDPMIRKDGYDEQRREGKGKARVFGQDLMRGEGDIVPGGHKKGTLYHSLSGRVPTYYRQKRAIEDVLGRTLDNKEFEEQYLVIADNSTIEATGTSIFDPVLCEVAYSWFTAVGGQVLDPFAGGSVRGVVAAYLGRPYMGIDLSERQIAANIVQGEDIVPDAMPSWKVGDSRNLDGLVAEGWECDFLFSCPPYADLEVYSEDPRDISTMKYPEFLEAYRDIVHQAVARLRDDRFACFVVGEVRGKDGGYYNFVSDTIQAFVDAGCQYYNEIVLHTSAGSLPIRVGRQFAISRKIGKTHQNVMVFCKGDPRAAADWCGEVEVVDPAAMFGEVAE